MILTSQVRGRGVTMSANFARDKKINLFNEGALGMYRNLVEEVKVGIYIAETEGNLLFVNEAFAHILGFSSKEEVVGLNLAQQLYVDPEERNVFLKAMEQTGHVKDYEVRNVRKDGSVADLSVTSHFIFDDQGIVVGVEGIVQDVTEKKKLANQLLLEKKKLEELLNFDESVNTIHRVDKLVDYIVAKVGAILNVEKCSLMLLDEANNELCIKAAQGIAEKVILDTRVKLGEGVCGKVAREGKSFLVKNIEQEPDFHRPNRPAYRTNSFMSAVMKSKDRVMGVINVTDKASHQQESFTPLDLKVLTVIARQAAIAVENAELNQELEFLSTKDPLTNLTNYRFFVQALDEEIKRLTRLPGNLSILMIDIDHFKSYNDTFGHLEGDQLLRDFAGILTTNLRGIDKVCRYGGDEFVVLLPGANVHEAKIVAEKLRRIVELKEFKQPVTISAGVAEFKSPINRFELTLRADRALYRAKQQGRNQVSE